MKTTLLPSKRSQDATAGDLYRFFPNKAGDGTNIRGETVNSRRMHKKQSPLSTPKFARWSWRAHRPNDPSSATQHPLSGAV